MMQLAGNMLFRVPTFESVPEQSRRGFIETLSGMLQACCMWKVDGVGARGSSSLSARIHVLDTDAAVRLTTLCACAAISLHAR